MQPIKRGTSGCFLISTTWNCSKSEPRSTDLDQWHPFLVAHPRRSICPLRFALSGKQRPPWMRPHMRTKNASVLSSKEAGAKLRGTTRAKPKVRLPHMGNMSRPVDVRNGGSGITRQRGKLHQLCVWWSQSGVEPASERAAAAVEDAVMSPAPVNLACLTHTPSLPPLRLWLPEPLASAHRASAQSRWGNAQGHFVTQLECIAQNCIADNVLWKITFALLIEA